MQQRLLLALPIALALGCSASAPSASTAPATPRAEDAGVEPVAPAADPTSWSTTGKLKTARALSTATLLADGRVLVAGGEDGAYAMLASVEVYDPAAGTFSGAAPLPSPRDHHTATRLKDGRVLVAGGGKGSEISLPSGEGTLATAVLYDPAADRWEETGSMNVPRAGHRAVLLDDGRVLVVGGGSTVGYPCASQHPDCTVADALATAEIYDPASGEWTPTGSLAQARLAFTLDVTPAGIVAAGGAADNRGLESVEIYDPAAGRWRAGPKLAGQRLYQATAVLDGKLVVAGGKIANVTPITSVDVLAPSAAAWKAGAALDVPRTGASFVPLQSGKALLVAGSNQVGDRFLAQSALYDASDDTWTEMAPLSVARYGQAAVRLDDGSVLVVGGRTATGVTSSAERTR